jgi:hypothetical protein
MNYRLRGLEPAQFERYFSLDDSALAERGMRWMRVDQAVGFPCRISLADAPVGEDVLLLPFTHQDGRSPYRASGPIFVRRGQNAAAEFVNELPSCLTLRPLSVRAYDAADEMIDADVVDGRAAESLIQRYLANDATEYLHVHFARRGCFACRVERE